MGFNNLARRLGAGAWLLMCVALLAGCAAPSPPRGSVHEGSVALGTRQVPLPPGPWTVVSETEPATGTYAGSSFTIHRIVLVQEDDGRPTGLIRARAREGDVMDRRIPTEPVLACEESASNVRPVAVKKDAGRYECRRVLLVAP
jgi:hypothetical protein